MKNILKTIFTAGTAKLVEAVGTAIDKNVTSKEERLQLKNDFTEIIQKHDYRMQEELTERHKTDMASDNKLSKLIRPMTLIYMTTFLSGLIITDSVADTFTVDEAWVKLLTILLVTVFSFYFGGRELQKWLINKKI